MTRLTHPYRRTIVTVGALTALGGWLGTWQLATGTATPPDADLPPGLDSWLLPAAWLCATVAVPWTAATWLAWRRSDRAPVAVLLACATLGVELAVQVPFVGFNALQLVFALVAVALAEMALEARRAFGPAPAHRGALPAPRAADDGDREIPDRGGSDDHGEHAHGRRRVVRRPGGR
jgi:hypothetical protein